MGMDLYIFKARTKKVFQTENWYNSESVTEVYYARKFWDLVENCSFIPQDYENGDFIELTRGNLEEIIQVACHNRDYFGTFNTVPTLCELLDNFDKITKEGFHYYLEFDY